MADPLAGPGDPRPEFPDFATSPDTGSFHQSGADHADADLAPPQEAGELGRLAGYRILRVLGRGGMGAVYAAEDPRLRRPVALKVMRPDIAKRPGAAERFLREARAAANIKDEHVVTIYQADEDRGTPFIAMEYLQGRPVDEWMRESKPTVPQVLKIGFETALGLAAAHAKGLVHRDIKPANLWLEAPHGRVKILDFGLARASEEDVQLTGTGVVVGTPAYMAPEQARGKTVDHRTDLFSLGCVLYHLATGRRPFTGNDAMAILTSLAIDTPTPPYELNASLPPALSAIILRLLEKDPAARPASAKAVATELKKIHKDLTQPGPAVSMSMPVMIAPAAAVGPTVWEDIDVSGSAVQMADAPEVVKAKKPAKGGFPWMLAASLLFAGLTILTAAGVLWKVLKPTTEIAASTEPTQPPATRTTPGTKPSELPPPIDPTFFNGKDLTGWEGNPKVWKVENGELVGTGASEGLGSARTVRDFRLQFEAKAVGGNFLVVRAADGHPRTFVGLTTPGDIWDATHATPPSWRHIAHGKPEARAVTRLGDFNAVEVTAVGKRLTVRVNGVLASDGVYDLADDGRLDWMLGSDGKELRVRNIRFTDLSKPSDPTFFNGKDLTGWVGDPKRWTVKNGELVGTNPEGANLILTTARRFGDFEVSFEARAFAHAPYPNTYFRFRYVQDGPPYGAIGLDHQLGNIWNGGSAPWRPWAGPTDAVKKSIRYGDYNAVRLRVVGRRVTLTVNEVPATDAEFDILADGSFRWDITPNCSELRVRNIRFTDLSKPSDPTFFNGKDLTDWIGKTSVWKVENGELIGTFPPGINDSAFIATRQDYQDFELACRIRVDGNLKRGSGLMFRADEPPPSGSSPRTRAEIKLGDKTGEFWRETGFVKGSDPAAAVAARPGDFDDVTLRVVGRRVTVTVNGVKALDGEFDLPAAGRIGWHVKSGTPIRIKDIRFTDLSSPVADDPERKATELLHPFCELNLMTPKGATISYGLKPGEPLPVQPFHVYSLVTHKGCPDFREAFLKAAPHLLHLGAISDVFGGGLPLTAAELTRLAALPPGKTLKSLSCVIELTPAVADALKGFPNLADLNFEAARTADDDALARLGTHPALRGEVRLVGLGASGKVTPKGIAALTGIRKLTLVESVGLNRDWCKALAGLPELTNLNLYQSATDDGMMAELARCPKLAGLVAARTRVTDASLNLLAGVKTLQWLSVVETKVTEAGVKQLAAARPDMTIVWDGGTIEPDPKAADRERKAAEWVMVVGGEISGASGKTFVRIQAGQPLPPGPISVFTIIFPFQNAIRDDSLTNLADTPNLTTLSVSRTGVTDTGLARIGKCTQLKLVYLSGLPITDDGLKQLKDLPLTTLHLESTKVTSKSVPLLLSWPGLTDLSLAFCPIIDADLDTLSGLKGLTSLNVANTKVSAAGVKRFAAARPFCTITWDGGTIEPDPKRAALERTAAEKLLKFGVVNVLTAEGKPATISMGMKLPDGPFVVTGVFFALPKAAPDFASQVLLPALADLGSLEQIQNVVFTPSRVQFSDAEFARLAEYPAAKSLTSLNIRIGLTPAAIETVKRFPKLLGIEFDAATADDAVLARLKDLPTLRSLTLANLGASGKVTVAGVSSAAKVSAGYLAFPGSTLMGAKLMGPIAEKADLTELDLTGCGMSDGTIAVLAGKENLVRLTLADNPVTDAVQETLRKLPGLRYVNLYKTKVTADGVKKLAAALPRCTIFWDGGIIGAKQLDPDQLAVERLRAGVGSVRLRMKGTRQVANIPPHEPLPQEPWWLIGVNFDKQDVPADFAAKTLLPAIADLEYFGEIGDPDLRMTLTAADLAKLAELPCAKQIAVLDTGLTLTLQTLDTLKRFPKLNRLNCWGTEVDDAILGRLKELPPLNDLGLRKLGASGKVTFVNGLMLIARAKPKRLGLRESTLPLDQLLGTVAGSQVEAADLSDMPIPSELLPALRINKTLTDLHLNRTLVTDAGLPSLSQMTTLRVILLRRTKVTEPGVKKLAEALPACRIEWDGGLIEPMKK